MNSPERRIMSNVHRSLEVVLVIAIARFPAIDESRPCRNGENTVCVSHRSHRVRFPTSCAKCCRTRTFKMRAKRAAGPIPERGVMEPARLVPLPNAVQEQGPRFMSERMPDASNPCIRVSDRQGSQLAVERERTRPGSIATQSLYRKCRNPNPSFCPDRH